MDCVNVKEEPREITEIDSAAHSEQDDNDGNCYVTLKIENLGESVDDNIENSGVSYENTEQTEFSGDFCLHNMSVDFDKADDKVLVKTEPRGNTPLISVDVEPMAVPDALAAKANQVDICSMYLEVQLSEGANVKKGPSVGKKSKVKKSKKAKLGSVEPVKITRLPLDAFANVHLKKRSDKPVPRPTDADGNPIKNHLCEICNRRFSKKNGLNEHMLIHTGLKPHRCDICFNTFRLKSNLSRHLITHTGNKPHFCAICSRKFTQKSDLTIHMYIHTGEKPYKCEVCNKSFSQHSSLSRHLLIHTGHKPFVCQICSKRFRKKCGLSNHMLVHSDQKPFTCDICSKSFTQKGGLQNHMFTHTGEKPYRCDICSKAFITNGCLTRHLLTHSGK